MIWKAYLDHAYEQNLAKPPFMRICRKSENWCDLRALSGKFLRQKSCYPESFRFLWHWYIVYDFVNKNSDQSSFGESNVEGDGGNDEIDILFG